ncbi:hypothetical protein SAMN05216205_4891 [Pseudomonas mohnii]|uniref:Uncharacterized protein n=1 Tax=Pseudomonas mohnii TaxID=395600 RepID=A0ABY0YC66_9PSED|nr:hypothetical protein [Pseudomonas mohnii]SED31672.1 hypothetical protein SAMN05216205_4891 [Pseudomonas mohnii]
MSAEQQLAILPAKEVALAVFSAPNGLDPYLQSVREEIDKFNASAPDVKTKKGQAAYRSIAYDLATSKTKLDAMGKELVAELKDVPKKIDAERKRVRELLGAWQEEVRRPLTEWETAEANKKREIEAWVGELRLDPQIISTADSEYLKISIGAFEGIVIDGDWLGEHEAEALRLKADTLAMLRTALEKRTKYEAEQAELVRLRAEAEAQAQRDREAQIAREAEERARREAEQRVQAERDATAKREAEAKAAADRRELELKFAAEQAERAAAQAAREKIESEQRAAQQKADDELRHQQAIAQAEADRIAAEQRAEQERINSEARQAEAAERARLAEVARQNAAADEILRQAAAREADKAHKMKINRAALDAFVAGGMPEECAKQAVVLIAQRKIPAITIQY